MSIVLATDDYPTIRPVLECLRRQTVKQSLELVLVTPAEVDMGEALKLRGEFANVRVVVAHGQHLAPARAAGVRAASAPLVFIGETHSFARPDLGEIVLAAFESREWSMVVPSIYNVNPMGALSWSGYILDYGQWAAGPPAGEIHAAPVYNAAYRKALLIDMGERLPHALTHNDELALSMKTRGLRTLFQPSAAMGHANVILLGTWIKNRFLGGALVARNRSEQWPVSKRIVYAGGSFLVPVVLLRRHLPWLRRILRSREVPAGTTAGVLIGLILRGAGEAIGYARIAPNYVERGMQDVEMHKLKYAGPVTV